MPIGWSSMNKGDAYILDIGEAFYVWNGDGCSRTERIKVSSMNKLPTNYTCWNACSVRQSRVLAGADAAVVVVGCQAMEYARRMRDDRGKGNIVVVEDGEENAASMGDDEFAVSEYVRQLRVRTYV